MLVTGNHRLQIQAFTLQSSETAIGPTQDFDKILVIGQIENGKMPTGWHIEKPNGSNADLESSEPPSEVREIGMVTKRKKNHDDVEYTGEEGENDT